MCGPDNGARDRPSVTTTGLPKTHVRLPSGDPRVPDTSADERVGANGPRIHNARVTATAPSGALGRSHGWIARRSS
jgi:hypothetical protein